MGYNRSGDDFGSVAELDRPSTAVTPNLAAAFFINPSTTPNTDPALHMFLPSIDRLERKTDATPKQKSNTAPGLGLRA